MKESVVKLGLKDSIKHSRVVLPLIILFEILLVINWFLFSEDKASIGSIGYLVSYFSLLAATALLWLCHYLVRNNLERYVKSLVRLHYLYVMFIMVWCTAFTYIASEFHGRFDYLLFITIVTLAPAVNFMRPAFWITLQLSCSAVIYWLASRQPHFISFAINFSVFTIISIAAGWFVYRVRRSGYERMIQLDFAANYNALTHLPNRQSFNQALSQWNTREPAPDHVAMVLDINGLKSCNDTKGHKAGDEMILGAAHCMSLAFQELGTVYHLGSDKFVAVLQADEAQLQQGISTFNQLTAKRKGKLADAISVSLGYVSAAEHPELSLEKLLSLADSRMLVNKHQYYLQSIFGHAGEGQVLSDEEMKQRRLEFQNRVGNALLRDYQAIFVIDLETGMTRPVKMEKTLNIALMDLPQSFEYQSFVDSYYAHFDPEIFAGDKKPDLDVVRQHFSQSTEPLTIRYRAHKSVVQSEYFEITLSLLDDNLRFVVLAVKEIDAIVDEIHQQKKALEEAMARAEQAHQQAVNANKTKSIFLFNMSHDIRTPMNAILGLTNMMENELDNIPKLKDHLKKVKDCGEFLLSLINNVLDMARIESGNARVEEEIGDSTEPGYKAIAMFEDQMAAKHITHRHAYDIKHETVIIDKMKVQQIIMNILSNAVKYTPQGGVITTSFAELPSERTGYGKFLFTCKDTGIGMTKEFSEHLFEMFSRERNTTTSGVMGVGLGMAIVKKLVDLLGGTITVQTEPGKGTTFIVTLYHKLVDPTDAYPAEEQTVEAVSLEGKRVLVAEDNDLNAEIALSILENMGIQAQRAVDGQECIQKLCAAQPGYYDAILMDIQMPRLNGYDATRQIRALENEALSTIPIVALTANAFEEDKQQALRSGMNGHIAKPINVPQLQKALSSLFR